MNFVSEKVVDGHRLVVDAPFDVEFMKDIRMDEKDVLIFDYDLTDIKTKFLFDTTDALFIVKFTRENLFVSSVIYIGGDDEDISSPYAEDGLIKTCVELTSNEKNRLLLFLTAYLGNIILKQ